MKLIGRPSWQFLIILCLLLVALYMVTRPKWETLLDQANAAYDRHERSAWDLYCQARQEAQEVGEDRNPRFVDALTNQAALLIQDYNEQEGFDPERKLLMAHSYLIDVLEISQSNIGIQNSNLLQRLDQIGTIYYSGGTKNHQHPPLLIKGRFSVENLADNERKVPYVERYSASNPLLNSEHLYQIAIALYRRPEDQSAAQAAMRGYAILLSQTNRLADAKLLEARVEEIKTAPKAAVKTSHPAQRRPRP